MSSHGNAATISSSSAPALKTTKPRTISSAAAARARAGANAAGTATATAIRTISGHSPARMPRRVPLTALGASLPWAGRSHRGGLGAGVVVAAGRFQVLAGLVQDEAEDVGVHERQALDR